MTQSLNVEYDELMARAAELDQPLPVPPQSNPQAPCVISFVLDSAVQLALSADLMRQYLKYGEREFQRLATSLRNAAKAYEEVDESAAASIDSTFSGGNGSADGSMSVYCDPDEDYYPPPPPVAAPPPAFEYPYYEVRQAATDIESVDQGAAYRAFYSDWDRYQRQLQTVERRFRMFDYWEGISATLVQGNFDAHLTWIRSMVSLCSEMAGQALTVANAHNTAIKAHPTSYHVSQCDYWYKYYVQTKSPYLYMAVQWYADMQTKSEEVLTQYRSSGAMPLRPISPKTPTAAHRIDPPPPKPAPTPVDPDPETPGDDPSTPGDDPSTPDDQIPDPNVPTDDVPTDELPYDDGNLPNPTDMPMGAGGAGMPGMGMGGTDPKLTDALSKALKGGTAGAGMKPAGLGGGGGAGMPSTPLQPSTDDGAASRPAAAGGPGTAGLGKAMSGLGGAGGGGMGGMAPMGGGGQGQNQGKGKRTQGQDDDALYTEDRAWTEGVIGRRRAKDAPDQ